MGPSTLGSWALLIARTLQARGVDADELFRRAKMDPRRLGDSNARYPLAAVQRLWALAVQASADPCFGLEVGRAWHPTSFHALGYAALAAATLREALGYVARYCRIVSSGARVDLVDHGTEPALRLAAGADDGELLAVSVRAGVQAGLAALAVLCRETRGGPIGLQRVRLAHRDDGCRGRLERFFECPVAFGARDNALVFAREALDAPLATANPVLARINAQAAAQYHAELESPLFADHVRAALRRAMPSGEVRQVAIARSLNVSLRSMQRKLAEEGTNFRSLLDETRRQLAEQYSRDATLSASEVAYLLGFEEASSFSRAMRRWQGLVGHRPSQAG